jgi:hypothetical protein
MTTAERTPDRKAGATPSTGTPSTGTPAAGAPAGRPANRADRFTRELAALKIPDPAAGRSALWLRTGGVLMALGLVLEVVAYLMSHGTADPLVQGDAVTIGLGGIAACVTGSVLFLRHSLTGFLRFWLARQSFDLAQLGDTLREERR